MAHVRMRVCARYASPETINTVDAVSCKIRAYIISALRYQANMFTTTSSQNLVLAFILYGIVTPKGEHDDNTLYAIDLLYNNTTRY